MRRYKFRLETVLRIRQMQEQVSLQQVAEAGRSVGRAIAAAEQASAKYEGLPLLLPPMDAATFASVRDDATRIALALARSSDDVTRARAVQIEAVGALVEAKRQVSLLEELDASRREAWRAEQSRAEIIELDDFSTTRAARALQERRREC